MKILKLQDFVKGWVVGDFEPSIARTKDFEVSVRHYRAKEREGAHVHKIATEITIINDGIFEMNGATLQKGDIAVLDPGQSANFRCLTDGSNTIIKIPSVKGDKYMI